MQVAHVTAVCPVIVAGLGYSGRAIADALQSARRVVWGTTRSVERAVELESAGYRMVVVDFGEAHRPDVIGVAACDAVLTMGTAEGAAQVAGAVRWSVSHGCRRAVYLSSTSVYGDGDGGWVSAETPVAPTTDMGRRRVEAERVFARSCDEAGVEWCVLRLPGIYGPGRTSRPRIVAGTYRYPDRGQRWANRIFVDDIGSAAVTLLDSPDARGVYLASDGSPFRARELIEFVCADARIPVPDSVPFDALPPASRPFWRGNRRCDTTRLRALGWSPAFPSFRVGLAEAWRREAPEGR